MLGWREYLVTYAYEIAGTDGHKLHHVFYFPPMLSEVPLDD